MKTVRNLAFILMLGVVSLLTMTNASAAGWKSSLNLPYGTIHGGNSRKYGAGEYKISISVDGFNKADGSVRKSGSTTMEVTLYDVLTGRALKYDTATYTYGTCNMRYMGSYSAGYKQYIFSSDLYNESTGGRLYYDGVKSNEVYMYPLP